MPLGYVTRSSLCRLCAGRYSLCRNITLGETMRSNARRALALTAIAFAGLAAAPAKAENFAFMLAANNDIGVLGLSSGSFKLCGNPGVSLTGLGYGPGPVLFSAGRITSSLYTINRTNGAATQVATSNITFVDLGSTV